jgi:diguanylate cyclase (GGDEF)-like protein
LNVAEVRRAIAPPSEKLAALVVMQGAESDLGIHVVVDRSLTLGRDPKVEVPLHDEGISRRHCRIFIDDDRYLVEDLGSTNGTLLNGEPVDRPMRLRAGDRIYLGACIVKFTHADKLEVGYHAQMDALISTDDLTGLVAKRRFDAACARAVEHARTTRTSLAVMMLDLDGLKQINDKHGHPVGAYVIAEVGKIIGAVVSAFGAACRFGGDEFAAFLNGVDKAGGREIAESIRKWVGQHRFEKHGAILRPTVSIGIAALPTDGRSADVLLRKADEALYRAKRTGRDRVRT